MRILLNQLNVTTANATYPYGQITDTVGVIDGTGLTEGVLGDVLACATKLANYAGVVPDGTQDNDDNGYQFLNAVIEFIDKIQNKGFTADIAPINTNIPVPIGAKQYDLIRSGIDWTITGLPFDALADTSVFFGVANNDYTAGDTFDGHPITTSKGWFSGDLVRIVKTSDTSVTAETVAFIDAGVDGNVSIYDKNHLVDSGKNTSGLFHVGASATGDGSGSDGSNLMEINDAIVILSDSVMNAANIFIYGNATITTVGAWENTSVLFVMQTSDKLTISAQQSIRVGNMTLAGVSGNEFENGINECIRFIDNGKLTLVGTKIIQTTGSFFGRVPSSFLYESSISFERTGGNNFIFSESLIPSIIKLGINGSYSFTGFSDNTPSSVFNIVSSEAVFLGVFQGTSGTLLKETGVDSIVSPSTWGVVRQSTGNYLITKNGGNFPDQLYNYTIMYDIQDSLSGMPSLPNLIRASSDTLLIITSPLLLAQDRDFSLQVYRNS